MSGPVTIKIKRVGDVRDLPLPARMSAVAAGFDLAAAVRGPVVLAPGEIRLIPCGFAMAIPPGYEGQVRPRSGLASKHGITLINSPGTIDSDYRGEIQVPLINLGPAPFTVERGMRIAQMVISAVPDIQLIEADALDDTARGERGFGHTGR